MQVKYLSNGTEVSVKTNELIEGKDAYYYNVLFKLTTPIVMYGYQSEFPYQSFDQHTVKEVVIRNRDSVHYILYSLKSTNYSKLLETIREIEDNSHIKVIFEHVKGDVIFKDNGMTESEVLYTLGKSVDSNDNHQRFEDPTKLVYANEYTKKEETKLIHKENDLKLADLILNKDKDVKYVAALDAGSEHIEYFEVELKQWMTESEDRHKSYDELMRYIQFRCLKLYQLTDQGMKIVWEKDESNR